MTGFRMYRKGPLLLVLELSTNALCFSRVNQTHMHALHEIGLPVGVDPTAWSPTAIS